MGGQSQSPTPEEIEARLRQLRGQDKVGQEGSSATGPLAPNSTAAGLGVAMRIGVELVSALAVGAGIGYGLDHLFGTKPWLLLVFFFIGAAAGILNVWRLVNGQGYGMMPSPKDRDGGEKAAK